jgi:hypothetical protein
MDYGSLTDDSKLTKGGSKGGSKGGDGRVFKYFFLKCRMCGLSALLLAYAPDHSGFGPINVQIILDRN